jgi:hypothetical protein
MKKIIQIDFSNGFFSGGSMFHGYFARHEDGGFVWDRRLRFDADKLNPRRLDLMFPNHRPDEVYHKTNTSVTFIDTDLDLSEIPPTLFLVAVINSHCVAFDLCIPIDMSLSDFSVEAAVRLEEAFADKRTCLDPIGRFRNVLDQLHQVHQTGSILSSRAWNQAMEEQIRFCPIQGIVRACRTIANELCVQ